MTLSVRQLLLLPLLGLATPAFAVSFSFSYVFDSAMTSVTGTFDGTPNGDFIENISNVTLQVNGMPVAAPIFTTQFDDFSAPPVVSFSLLTNNFAFADVDLAGGAASYTLLFFLAPNSAGAHVEWDLVSDTDLGVYGTWQVQRIPDPGTVPDASSSAGLLVLALGVFGLLRRRPVR